MIQQQQQKQQEEPIDQLRKLPEVKNVAQPDVMFAFDGDWLPSQAAALIGPNNFQKLINMRYNTRGVEGVTGYTEVNTTGITTYQKIKTGIHLRTQGRTQEDYVLVQAHDGEGSGRIYQNQTAIGSQGDFEDTQLLSDSSANLVGRFSKAPNGNIAYCNGEDVAIWGGNESTIAAAFTTTTDAEALPINITDEVINSINDSDNRFTWDQATRPYLTILTTRPAKGFKFYIATANETASELSGSYWDGDEYIAVAEGGSDGTSSGGCALAQTGTFSFDDTLGSVKLHHFEERYLYAYQFELSAGSAVVYEITADFSMQAPSNIWDGIFRQPIQAQVYTHADTAYEDFSLHVGESSTVNIPVGCIMDGFVATNDKLIIMFTEKIAGIKMIMLGNLINKATSDLTVKYWNGAEFTTVGDTLSDGTSQGGTITLAKSGLVSWNPPGSAER